MKNKSEGAKWWKSPPVLVLSVLAAAALLFFSGRAAVRAYADGEEEKIYIVQYIVDDPSYQTDGEGTTYEGLPATKATVTGSPEEVLVLNAAFPVKEKMTFRGWLVRDQSTATSNIMEYENFVPTSYFRQVGDSNVYVTTAEELYHREMKVVFDQNTDDIASMPRTAYFYDSNPTYADGYTLPSVSECSRRGFLCKRWLRHPGDSEGVEKLTLDEFDDSTYDSGENVYAITVYADWNQAYRVNYDYNGGTYDGSGSGYVDFETQPGERGVYSFEGSIQPRRDYCIFKGWSPDNTNNQDSVITSVNYPDGFTLGNTKYYTTVYAVWEEREYSFTYVPNLPRGVANTDMTDSTVKKTYSQMDWWGYSFVPSTPTADGCEFTGWTVEYIDNDGNPQTSTPPDPRWYYVEYSDLRDNNTNEYTITAHWKKLYKLNFDPNAGGDSVTYTLGDYNGTGISENYFDANGEYEFYFTEPPVRDGYVYAGTSAVRNGPIVTKVKESDFDTLTDGKWTKTLYGNWTVKPVITYHSNFPDYDGEQLATSLEGNVGTATYVEWETNLWGYDTVSNASKGHEFCYWRDGEGNHYNHGDSVVFEGNTDLYAVWKRKCYLNYVKQASYSSNENMPDNEYFDVMADDLGEGASHPLSDRIPYLYGNTFKGWSTAADGSSMLSGSIPMSAFAYNSDRGLYEATAYAVWEPKNCDYRYFSDLPEGSVITSFPEDELFPFETASYAVSSTVPVAPGYTFRGWSVDQVKENGEVDNYGYLVDPGDNYPQDMDQYVRVEFHARWYVNYTVFYNANVEEGVTVDNGMGGGFPTSTDFSSRNMTDGKYTISSDVYSSYYRSDDSEGHSYRFMGWSLNDRNDPADVVTELVHENFTLNESSGRFETTIYCDWARKTEIVYHSVKDCVGADFHDEPYIEVFKGDPGIADHMVRSVDGSCLNYHTFLYWSTNEDGTGDRYDYGDMITTDEDIHLYAQMQRYFIISYVAESPYDGNSSVVDPNYEKFDIAVKDMTDEMTVADISSDLFKLEATLTGSQDRYFLGWSLKSKGTVNDVISAHTLPLSSFTKRSGYGSNDSGRYGIMVYSVWSTKPYAIDYDANMPVDNAVVTQFPENESPLTYAQVRNGHPLSDIVPKAKGFTFLNYDVYYDGFVYGSSHGSPGCLNPGSSTIYEMFLSDSQKITAEARWYQRRELVLLPNVDDGTETLEEFTEGYFNDQIRDWDAGNPEYFPLDGTYRRFAHSLDYWSYTPDGSEEATSPFPFEKFSVNDATNRYELKLYAMWKRAYHIEYDMNFNGDDNACIGISHPSVYDYISTLVENYDMTTDQPTRPGYVFKGWALTPDATEPLADNKLPLSNAVLNRGNERYEVKVYAVWEPNGHTVSYELEYGEGVTAEEVGCEAPEATPHSYREEGIAVAAEPSGYDAVKYSFEGWTTTDVTVTEGKFTMPDKDVVFKGKFTLNKRTVTYKPNGGGGEEIVETLPKGGSAAVKPENTFVPPFGQEFDRWDCDTEGYSTTPGDAITLNDNIVYTAVWKTLYYTLRYDKGSVPAINGSLPATRSDFTLADVRAGVNISETSPTADGYRFTGWRIANSDDGSVMKEYDAEQFGSMTDEAKRVDEALFNSDREAIAVAQWVRTFTVTYKVDCPDGVSYPALQTETYDEGEEATLKEKPTGYDESRYRFIGWNSDDIDTSGDTFTVSQNILITGCFEETEPVIPDVCRVSYYSGLNSSHGGYNDSCADPFVLENVPTGAYRALGNMTENGPQFNSYRYTFAGWRIVTAPSSGSRSACPTRSGAGDDGIIQPGDTVTLSGDTTLNAVWQCKLKYDANGGSGDLPNGGSDISKYVDDKVTAASGGNLAKDGKTFRHWNTKPGDDGDKIPAGGSFTIKDDTVLYAIYSGSSEPEDGEEFTVTYHANGAKGTVPHDKAKYREGAPVKVRPYGDLVREGCTFKEWNTKQDGSGKGYKGDGTDSFKMPGSNVTLYAIWVDGSGKIIPSPGTGESNMPMAMAFGGVMISLSAMAAVAVFRRRRIAQKEQRA